MNIHPTAVVDPTAELGQDVTIGPYAVIESDVIIGDGTEIMAHAFIGRYTTIGSNCRIFPKACIGSEPQDLKFTGEKTELIIGNHTVLRELVTIHRGTAEGGGRTSVGDHCLLMNYVHVAHDCHIGSHVIAANSLGLGGHVVVEDHASFGGMVGVHQFTRIGTHAFVGGFSRVNKDIPPYMLGEGAVEFQLHGPNLVGLKRKGFSKETIDAIKDAFRLIFRNRRPLDEVLEETRNTYPNVPEIKYLIDFIKSSSRGVFR